MSASAVGAHGTAVTSKTILDFLHERTRLEWDPDRDLFESGAVTSLFALELVVFLEESFGVSITGDELRLDNFRTVTAMTALVHRLREAA